MPKKVVTAPPDVSEAAEPLAESHEKIYQAFSQKKWFNVTCGEKKRRKI
jgi:hypothetical protein